MTNRQDLPGEFRVKLNVFGEKPVLIAVYEVKDGIEYGHAISFPTKEAALEALGRTKEIVERLFD